ncbi:HAD family hydrolase [Neobacillus muris]|uniref:HAD family hydrolase n=1 Tax=Neobacillus muris TaxID=2941334 RepID=UPI00203CB49F|nr:HAD family hydrolase [Neobacillus muris]
METILFDVDDTLYDQLQPFKLAFEKKFQHIKDLPIDQLFISSRKHSDRLFNQSEAGTISLLELHTYRLMAACQEFGLEISQDDAIEIQKTYEEEQQKITLVPEVEYLLEHLYQEGKQLGILTNGPYEHQLRKINQLGLGKWIPDEHIFISSAIGAAKPAHEAFQFVEKKLRLNRDKTVYIGDSFDNDVIGAKQAGWNSIWMNHRGRTMPNSTFLPDQIVHTHKELWQLFLL